jgi:hypothetical protein
MTASAHVRRQAAANEPLLTFVWRWVKRKICKWISLGLVGPAFLRMVLMAWVVL